MKINELKIERVCKLRYNNVKIQAIAINERLSEKTVRIILKNNYPTFEKIRKMTQQGYPPCSNSPFQQKPVSETEKRYDEGYTGQDAPCSKIEYQELLEKINEQERLINTFRENDRIKELHIQKENAENKLKNDALNEARREIDRLKGKNAEYEKLLQSKDQQINYLKEYSLNEFQILRHDFSDLKTTLSNNNTTVLEKITILTKTHDSLNLDFQTLKTTTLEKIKLEQELQTLKDNHMYDLLKYCGVATISFGAGMVVDHFYPSFLDSIGTKINELIKNTFAVYTDHPITLPGITPSDLLNICSEVTSGTNASGFLCSGIFSPNNGENYRTGYVAAPTPSDDMNQANIQGTSNNITTSINISSTTQCSGIDRNNHIETMEHNTTSLMSQATSHYIPPPAMPPVYSFHYYTPIPNDLRGPCGLIPIKKMNWMQSTLFLGWLFEQFGYKVPWRPKSHDQGGDILLERFGEKIVIQLKHRKENTGTSALKDALYAKKMHDATRARVISFSSPFTKDALKEAKKADIELWDLEWVIAEMRKHNINYPIE